jgi:large subunit ribosomal protein L3
MCAKPGRILRGKKMPGQYGNTKTTLRSAKVVHVDTENNLIAVKGAVPGSKNNFVFVSAQ